MPWVRFLPLLVAACAGAGQLPAAAPGAEDVATPADPTAPPIDLAPAAHVDPPRATFTVGPDVACATPGTPGVFVESREALGITFVHASDAKDDIEIQARGGGVSVNDFDGDGHLDLYFAQGDGHDEVYLTGGRGPLAFERRLVGKPTPMAHIGAYGADADNDGDVDVLLTCSMHDLHLAINDGHGNFTMSADGVPDATIGVEHGAAWGDVNADGTLDIIAAGGPDASYLEKHPGGPQRLLLGGPGLTFTEAPFPTFNPEGRAYIAAPIDVDDDRDLDIYVVNDFGSLFQSNELLINDGQGHFTDVSFQSNADVAVTGMGLAVGDFDNDGRMDLCSSTMSPQAEPLLRNLGGGEFEDVGYAWKANTFAISPGVGWGGAFIDVENDGDEDLFVAHGHHPALFKGAPGLQNGAVQRSVLLANIGGSFVDASASSGLGREASSRAPVEADLDEDGFPDLVVGNMEGPPFVYLNHCSPEAAWIGVRLDGPTARNLGARIEVLAGGVKHVRELGSGNEGLFGSGPAAVTIGLGAATVVDTLRVSRIGGEVIETKDVPVRRWVELK